MEDIFDCIIIGSGPAGLTCGIYGVRAGLKVLILEDPYNISQITTTYEIDNYTGFHNIAGQDLFDKMYNHAKDVGVNIIKEKVIEILDIEQNIKKIRTKSNFYMTKNVVLATGATPKKLGVEGEEEYAGCGVSYCATCDGAFFDKKTVAVVGGGDVAIEDAIFLSRICNKVYVLIRKDYMRATKILQDNLMQLGNVEVLYQKKVSKIIGHGIVEEIEICDSIDNTKYDNLKVDGVFVAIGIEPCSKLLENKVLMENGFVKTNEDCQSSIKGIFAIGDVRTKQLRQIITACSDGANCITTILKQG